MCSRFSPKGGQLKVGRTKVAIKATSQAIIRSTDKASVICKGSGGLEEAQPTLGVASLPGDGILPNQTARVVYDRVYG